MPAYSQSELDSAALRDLISDAETAEDQAVNGPFYPEKNINPETLRAYAAKCRASAERYRDGGAHAAVLSGKA
jgi:hypothetical protein